MTIHDEIVLKLTQLDENGRIYLKQIIDDASDNPVKYRIEHLHIGGYNISTESLDLIRPDITVFFDDSHQESLRAYANPPIHGFVIEIENDIQWDFARSLQQIKDYFHGFYPIVIIPEVYERFRRLYEHEGIETLLWSCERVWECMKCGAEIISKYTAKPSHEKKLSDGSTCKSNELRLKGIKNLMLVKGKIKIKIA